MRERHGEYMLRELVKRWANHKILVRWLSRFCFYLDRFYVARRGLPTLNDVGFTSFHDLVYQEIQSEAKDVLLALVSVYVINL